MRFALVMAVFSVSALGQSGDQLDPEAAILYTRATTALRQLPAYQVEVETVLAKPHAEPGADGFHVLAKLTVLQPDKVLVSGSTPFTGEMTVFSDGHSTLFWQESTNQFARIDAALPARSVASLTLLTPELEPTGTLVSAKLLRDEEIDLDGERFHCAVIEVSTEERSGAKSDPRPRTLWIDRKTGVALRQQTGVTPPHLDKEIPATIAITRFHTGDAVNANAFSFIVPADAAEVDWHLMDLAVTARGLVGRPVPALHLTTVDGHPLDLAKLHGKPVLLHLQTTWCKPCDDAAVVLDNAARTIGGEVKVLRVNIDESAEIVKSAGSPHFTAMAPASDAESLGLRAWPANLLIGRDGKVLSFEAGRASEAALLALMRKAASPDAVAPVPVWGVMDHKRVPRGTVAPPELVYKFDPGYTTDAQKNKVSGSVMLSIVVDTQGHVSDIRLLEKLEPGLDCRAISAVSKWRFKPAMQGTTPVAFRARAVVSFNQQ